MPGFFTRKRCLLAALLFLLSLLMLACGLEVARTAGQVFRALAQGQDSENGIIAQLLILALLTGAGEFGRRRTTEALALDYARHVRIALFERMLRRPFAGQRERSRGSQLLPFVGDLTALRVWWSDGIARGSSALLVLFGLGVWLTVQDARLGAALGGLSALSLIVMALLLRPFARTARRQRRERGKLTAVISDRIAGAHAIFALGGLRRELGRVETLNDRMNRAAIGRATWSGALRGLTAAYTTLALLALLVLAREGAIAPHELVGSLTLAGMIGASLADLGRAMELAIPARIANEKLTRRFAEIQPDAGLPIGRPEKQPRALVRIEGMRLARGWATFDSEANRGEVILVDADSSRARTLLFSQLAGLTRPYAGDVLLGGQHAQCLSQKWRRRRLGIAAPWLPLLAGGARDNACFRLRKGDSSSIAELAEGLGIAALIAENRIISQEGHGLAPHDRAALRLLRALEGSPAVILLDEADADLLPEQVEVLARHLATARACVILSARSADLRGLAHRHWRLANARITDARPDPALRLAFQKEGVSS